MFAFFKTGNFMIPVSLGKYFGTIGWYPSSKGIYPTNTHYYKVYMGVSENSGIPKSSILIRFSIINHPFWGYHHCWKHPYWVVILRVPIPRVPSRHFPYDSSKLRPLTSANTCSKLRAPAQTPTQAVEPFACIQRLDESYGRLTFRKKRVYIVCILHVECICCMYLASIILCTHT